MVKNRLKLSCRDFLQYSRFKSLIPLQGAVKEKMLQVYIVVPQLLHSFSGVLFVSMQLSVGIGQISAFNYIKPFPTKSKFGHKKREVQR